MHTQAPYRDVFLCCPRSSITRPKSVVFMVLTNSTGCDLSGGHFAEEKEFRSAIDYPKPQPHIPSPAPILSQTKLGLKKHYYLRKRFTCTRISKPTYIYKYNYPIQTQQQPQLINTACGNQPVFPEDREAVTFAAAASGGTTPIHIHGPARLREPASQWQQLFQPQEQKQQPLLQQIFPALRTINLQCNYFFGEAAVTPSPKPAPTSALRQPHQRESRGASTICKQVTVLDQNTGKITEPGSSCVSDANTNAAARKKHNTKSSSTSSFTVFNVKGDVWGKIKSL